ncbi:polysaccharide deacetylase family protein [Patescibacteria group bacterium]|nr:polysaccharide deacetylase family protein [Patescibacteria group bacterium]
MNKINNKKLPGKINWVNFLHIYQPPWQDKGILEQVSNESYEYLLSLFEKYSKFKASLNISGNLVEQLEDAHPDILKRLQALVKNNQIELTGSSKYHALLPMLSEKEIRRQIELNKQILSQYFDKKKIKGFYMPEMAYSDTVAKVVKKQGFEWIILDPICYKAKVDNNFLYIHHKTGLKVVFRDRQISKSYPAEIIFHKLNNLEKGTIITGTDGEIYGHFHQDWQGHIEKIMANKNLRVETVGQYLKKLKEKKRIELRAGSWESSEEELKKKNPYALWNSPKNKIHKSLWSLVDLATELVNKYKKDKNWNWARRHLDRGQSSCTFWWASAQRPSDFSPLTWNPDMIDNGSEELIKAVRSLSKASYQEKIRAEKIYIDIKKNTWLDHWRKYHK